MSPLLKFVIVMWGYFWDVSGVSGGVKGVTSDMTYNAGWLLTSLFRNKRKFPPHMGPHSLKFVIVMWGCFLEVFGVVEGVTSDMTVQC